MATPTKRPQYKVKCYMCLSGKLNIDYKAADLLRRFLLPNGKIKPRRLSNLCAKHQRMVSNAIKKARFLALLPFVINDTDTRR
ncbi:MAG: 30S ribosomal protein S18 [Mycoplasmataceae bacterium]|jgi:small subunit ribosomal protein S18|nr:30S ribosomal protein S18 [Mycoplasmataceae bacterium]